jgi:hypothetical protein
LADGRITADVMDVPSGKGLPAIRARLRHHSYASQGKTVDHVLFSDSAIKAATNQQQWYVTISRGRKGVTIFTSDKVQLARTSSVLVQLERFDSYARLLGPGVEQKTGGARV